MDGNNDNQFSFLSNNELYEVKLLNELVVPKCEGM